MRVEPKEKAKELLDKVIPHTQYWDGYNDCPLDYDHGKKVVLLWVNEILAALELPDDIDYWERVKAYVRK